MIRLGRHSAPVDTGGRLRPGDTERENVTDSTESVCDIPHVTNLDRCGQTNRNLGILQPAQPHGCAAQLLITFDDPQGGEPGAGPG